MIHDWNAHARTVLAQRGYKWGAARLAVVDALASHDCCLSAREIADELQARGGRAGLASVYRAVELLHELGLVQRLEVGDGTARYELADPTGEHHHHVVCDVCGQVSPFEDERLEAAIHALSERVDHTIDTHDVVLHGACRDCSDAAAR